MPVTKIKKSDVSRFTQAILKRQDWKCALCGAMLKANSAKDPVLDHCHDTGLLRGVLCRNCNGMEGKVDTCATRATNKAGRIEWLRNLVTYLSKEHYQFFHYTHKTPEEKRVARNKAARDKRAKAKAELE